MEKKSNIEIIYDLIEKADFDELSKQEKNIVLIEMTAEEYQEMRSTIVTTESLYNKSDITVNKQSSTRKIFMHKIEIYKVAAVFIILIGITYLIAQSGKNENKTSIAMTDTLYVVKKDTVTITKTDTVEIIKIQFVVQKDQTIQTQYQNKKPDITNENYKPDCNKELCPSDINQFSTIKSDNSFSGDSSLKKLMVLL